MDLMKGGDKFTQAIKAGWRRRAEPIPGRKKLLILIMVGLLFYGGIIALDNIVLRPHLNEIFGEPIDLSYYQERGQAILDGQIPYRDFESESPPLVMYLMVIPQYFGGEMWMYQLYFALFAIMTSVSIYLGFRRYNDFYAFTAGISYLFLPYAFIEFTLGVQDDRSHRRIGIRRALHPLPMGDCQAHGGVDDARVGHSIRCGEAAPARRRSASTAKAGSCAP